MARYRAAPLLGSFQQTERQLRHIEASLGSYPTQVATGDVTLTDADDTVLVDSSGGDVVVTLPLAADVLERCFTVKKMDAANTVTVQPSGSETIDGASSLSWDTNLAAYTVQAVTLPSGDAGWIVVATFGVETGTAPSAVVLTADGAANATNTLGNITGLSFAVAAGKKYCFEFYVVVVHSNRGLGYKVGLTCPASATLAALAVIPTAASDVDGFVEGPITASGGSVSADTFGITSATPTMVRVTGVLITGANAGTLQVQHAMFFAGAASVTPKAGCSGLLTTLT